VPNPHTGHRARPGGKNGRKWCAGAVSAHETPQKYTEEKILEPEKTLTDTNGGAKSYPCDGCGEGIVWWRAHMTWWTPDGNAKEFCPACEDVMLLALEGRMK
jgi:hypothetical protein